MDFYPPKIRVSRNNDFEIEVWIRYVQHRLTVENKNYIIVICGETGSGKSWLALKIMELLDVNPSMKKVFFSGLDFMKYCNTSSKPSDVVIWDESGIKDSGMFNREWHDNKDIVSVFQIMRFLNFCLVITVPSMGYIDSGVRNLIHLYIEVKRIDRIRGLFYAEPKRLQHNPLKNKTYKKIPRFKVGEKIYKMKQLILKRPSKNLTDKYEKIQKKFKSKLINQYVGDMEQARKHKNTDWTKPKDISEQIKLVASKPEEYNVARKGLRLGWELIGDDFDVGEQTAKKIKRVVEKKLRKSKEDGK